MVAVATPDQLAAVKALQDIAQGEKHDASGAPSTTGFAHGPGGTLSFPGVDADVFQTIVGSLNGLLMAMPTRPSLYTDPTYEVLTGIQASTGVAPTEPCDDAEQAGLLKAGIITSPFGRYRFGTREVDITRLGKRNDRADPVDLRMIGNPIGGNPFGAVADPSLGNDMLTNEFTKMTTERAVFAHRRLSQKLFSADPANGNLNFPEFAGLEQLVSTGYVDAQTGIVLPSIDSDIKQFDFQCVDDAGPELVDALTYLARFVRSLARRTGVDPVRWMFAMREELFYEITAIWPCNYLSYRCVLDGSSANVNNIDARDATEFRDAMRAGNYLIIDGIRYDVALDDGITEQTDTTTARLNAGQFASDIYLLPMSVLGGASTLYWDYFDHGNPSIASTIGTGLTQTRVTDRGMWIEWPRQTNNCVVFDAEIELRVVLRTPWLAGRLQDVCYEPLQHTRSPFPDDPYFVNGGVTERAGPSLHAHWKD